MTNPTRARGHAWQFIDGVFCLAVHGDDKGTSVALPIGALLTLAADGRRRQMALHRRTMSPAETSSSESIPVTRDSVLPVQTWSVAPVDNGMVALILDRGLDTELLLGLSPEVARTLADMFIKHAGGAPRPTPSQD